ncbi:MAG TPA: hypothetical protein VGX93_04980 [Chthoniobacterales bacterium]|jgi:hypothetical protein|nr:hypothetical protein [Chthoniobacterales bacterium]
MAEDLRDRVETIWSNIRMGARAARMQEALPGKVLRERPNKGIIRP